MDQGTAPAGRPPGDAVARPRVRWLVPLGMLAAATWLALSAWLIVWPGGEDYEPVDAVVALAGADGGRLRVARDLVASDPGAQLVLSVGTDRRVRGICARPPEDVHCFRADPLRTSGEARALGQLAREEGWEALAIVTSTTHLTRAGLLVRQCVDAEVVMIDAGRWAGELPGRVLREWGGLLGALTFDRAC